MSRMAKTGLRVAAICSVLWLFSPAKAQATPGWIQCGTTEYNIALCTQCIYQYDCTGVIAECFSCCGEGGPVDWYCGNLDGPVYCNCAY